MQEDEYYKKSSERNLPLRCPILNYCGRRAWTIYLFSEYSKYDPSLNMLQALQKDGTLPDDYEEKEITVQGEPPSIIRGNDHYYFSHACPEVNLFGGWHALMSGHACTHGSYDKYYKQEKNKIHKTGHFSECAEFNKYSFDNNKLIRKKRSNRKTIPYKTKALLQKEINSTCPFCESLDVDHFQIHHIDENLENNSKDNLLMLCPTCHSKITKGDITMDQVKNCKTKLKE
tara:strand:- start:1509 stop:2198 length:690 start_codon:yes stop_codon:yes gene_type:complete